MNMKKKKIRVSYYFLLLGMLLCMPIYGQQVLKIKGTVKDAKLGTPLPGVSVLVKGTSNGASTDFDGNYVINAKSSDVLLFSFVGYKTLQVAVNGKTKIDATLAEESNQLDEIVVIGYGTAKKKDLTGSVASISAADIAKTPVANVAMALQGKLAGVNVSSQDGRPGAEISIRIRGGGSVTQSNQPLFVVDGFIVSSINNIPGSQIERIDVLKDASATAIYGASGANGVVLVSTKSGKAGKTSVTYDAYTQINTPTKYLPVMDGYDYILYNWSYAQAIGDSYANAWEKLWLIGNEFKGSNTAGIDRYKNVASENFSKQVYKTSFTHNQDFNISSGTEKTKYIFSVNYLDQEGMKLNSGYKRANASFKLDQKLSDKLTFTLNTRFVQEDANGDEGTGTSGGSALSTAFWFRPIATADVLGDLNVVTNPLLGDYNGILQDNYNPVKRINDFINPNITRSLVANTALSWNITKGLTFKTDLSLNTSWSKKKQWTGATYNLYLNPQGAKTYGGNAVVRASEGKSYRWINTLNYEIQGLGDKHKANILAGSEASEANSEYAEVWGNKYPASFDSERAWANMDSYTRDPLTINGGMSTKVNPSISKNSYFGRTNYSYLDRYLFSATFRADGSSSFATENRWGYFPAASGAWRISKESFMQNINWVSDLKLRVSYGEVGNDNIASGLWQQQWASGGLTRFSLNEAQQSSYTLASSQLANHNIKWETTTTRNLGLDFTLFNGRLNGTVDVYKNTVRDLLLITPITPISGFTTTLSNVGATSNKGVEVSFNGDIINTKNFNLKGSVNVNVNRGNVDALAPGINNTYNSGWAGARPGGGDYVFEVGKPVGLVRGWVADGMYTTKDFDYNPAGGGVYTLKTGVPDIASGLLSTVYGTVGHKPGAQTAYPGVPKYKDANSDGVIDVKDIGIIGNMNPKHTGGFSLSGNYKDFDFGMDFNWSYGNDVYNADHLNNYLGNKETGLFRNRAQELAGAYKIYGLVGGQITSIVDPTALDALNANATTFLPFAENTMISSYAIEDGSYLRLNTVTLGYTLPKSIGSKAGFNRVRIYGSIYNALTITGYNGLDPEVSTNGTRNGIYPTPGLDYGAYPRARSYTLGVNIEF